MQFLFQSFNFYASPTEKMTIESRRKATTASQYGTFHLTKFLQHSLTHTVAPLSPYPMAHSIFLAYLSGTEKHTKSTSEAKLKQTANCKKCSHVCVSLCTIIVHITALNSSDNLPSYLPDSHQMLSNGWEGEEHFI